MLIRKSPQLLGLSSLVFLHKDMNARERSSPTALDVAKRLVRKIGTVPSAEKI
jgi:hypothetical protein